MFTSSHFSTNTTFQEDGKEALFEQQFYKFATKLNTKASTITPLLPLETMTITTSSYTSHFVFNPDDIPRFRIQEIYEHHLGNLLCTTLHFKRPTITYSQPKNIRDSPASPSSRQKCINNYGGVSLWNLSIITPPIFSYCFLHGYVCFPAIRENFQLCCILLCYLEGFTHNRGSYHVY